MGGHSTTESISPACNGMETEEELRALVIQQTMSSFWHPTANRSIRMLAGLSFASLINLVEGMSREACLEILGGPAPITTAAPASPPENVRPAEVETPDYSRIPALPER